MAPWLRYDADPSCVSAIKISGRLRPTQRKDVCFPLERTDFQQVGVDGVLCWAVARKMYNLSIRVYDIQI